jgi:hypothetical protein
MSSFKKDDIPKHSTPKERPKTSKTPSKGSKVARKIASPEKGKPILSRPKPPKK